MKNQVLTELTNKYFDNDLSPDEKILLDKLLTEPGNKKYFESMNALFIKIDSAKPLTQQIEISDSVINIISKQNRKPAMTKKIKNKVSSLFNGTKISYAMTFACGVLLAAFIFLFQSGNVTNDEFMTGTISSGNFNETYYMDDHKLTGSIDVNYTPEIVVMDIHLDTGENVNCGLSFDNNQLSLYGIKNVGQKNNGKISTGKNTVYLSNIESNHYMVFFKSLHNNPTNVLASFYDGQTVVSNLKIEIKN